MQDNKQIDYAATVAAARGGDEDSYECLYNATAGTVRAVCRKYMEPSEDGAEAFGAAAIKETYLRLYDRLPFVSDPDAFPALAVEEAREVCRKGLSNRTVTLSAEEYIDVGAPGAEDAPEPLVSADECRTEVRENVMLDGETIEDLALTLLRRLTKAERYTLLRWNEGDSIAPEEEPTLRSAFIRTEQEVMALEEERSLRALDFARSRLSFFNWVLDLYDRFVEGSSEPDLFPEIWETIRREFYLKNTTELPVSEMQEEYAKYLDDETGEEPGAALPKKKKKGGFLSTWWGRGLLGLLLIVLVLLGVIVTAGQHTSHAQALGGCKNAPTVSVGASFLSVTFCEE